MTSIFKFYRRKEIWIMYFHDASKEECKNFKDEYIGIAEKLYGMIRNSLMNPNISFPKESVEIWSVIIIYWLISRFYIHLSDTFFVCFETILYILYKTTCANVVVLLTWKRATNIKFQVLCVVMKHNIQNQPPGEPCNYIVGISLGHTVDTVIYYLYYGIWYNIYIRFYLHYY